VPESPVDGSRHVACVAEEVIRRERERLGQTATHDRVLERLGGGGMGACILARRRLKQL
jgi:hypothetical protein